MFYLKGVNFDIFLALAKQSMKFNQSVQYTLHNTYRSGVAVLSNPENYKDYTKEIPRPSYFGAPI